MRSGGGLPPCRFRRAVRLGADCSSPTDDREGWNATLAPITLVTRPRSVGKFAIGPKALRVIPEGAAEKFLPLPAPTSTTPTTLPYKMKGWVMPCPFPHPNRTMRRLPSPFARNGPIHHHHDLVERVADAVSAVILL